MIKNGVFADAQKKEKDQVLFEGIILKLINGQNLSAAITTKKEFSEYEYHALRIGEQTGTLQRVAKELGSFYKRKNEQRRIVVSALSYPIVVLCRHSWLFCLCSNLWYLCLQIFLNKTKSNCLGLPKLL